MDQKDMRFRDPNRDEELIDNMVEAMVSESMPGTEGRSRDELVEVVRRVHEEIVQRVLSRELSAADAPAQEWKRAIEELAKPADTGQG